VTGDVIGLLGRNGSGKSTLLKIIFGTENTDFKFIQIDGVVKSKTSDLFKEITYLSQDNFIPNHFTVKKAILLTLEKERIEDFYGDVIIEAFLDKKISHLSGGELLYLEIKLVLFNSSKFVLLDEPYNGLSPLMIEVVNKLIQENARQKGIIITDHNYENVMAISTKLILIKEGKTHHLTKKSELIEKRYLSDGMC
jgi:ABC-type multidrug transport system ATPase subunit